MVIGKEHIKGRMTKDGKMCLLRKLIIIANKEQEENNVKITIEKKTKSEVSIKIKWEEGEEQKETSMDIYETETIDEEAAIEASIKITIEKKTKSVYRDWETDRKSTRLNSSHSRASRMPSSA